MLRQIAETFISWSIMSNAIGILIKSILPLIMG
jgi:hypothetical protein